MTAPTNQADCQALSGTWTNNDHIHNLCTLPPIANMTLDQQVQSYMDYRALGACVTYDGNNLSSGGGIDIGSRITQTTAKSGKWFADFWGYSTTTNGVYLDGTSGIKANDAGNIDCSQTGLVTGALKLWNNWAPDEALCAFGFRMADDSEFNAGRCTNAQGGSDDFKRGNDVMNSYKSAVKNRIYGGKEPSLSSAANYLLYLKTFQKLCAPTAITSTSPPTGSTDRDYAVNIVTGNGKDATIQTTYYTSRSNKAQSDGVEISPGSGFDTLLNADNKSCGDLVKAINGDSGKQNGLANAYLSQLHHTGETNTTGPAAGQQCPAGATTDAQGNPCKTTGSVSSCAIDGVGWILCPILTAGAGLADSAYGFLADNFLATDPSLVNTDPNAVATDGQVIGTGTFTAWKIMQGIGNVAFIIAVLIIIFSQLTGIGISNYGVKKLLPRVIVAAILVNLSFLVRQIAVDLSNILGFSFKGLLDGVAQQVKNAGGGAPAPTGDQSGNLGGIAATVLIIGSTAWINIGALIVAVVGALVVLLTIFVLLIARKVLIVLLIVIAPLAFVAYLLPNTESLFHKWRKMLTSLLLLYPIIGLLYGASLLASAVLLQVAGHDTVLRIAAYMALVLPLIAAIPLLKGSLDGIGKLGGAIQSFGQKARGSAQGGVKQVGARYKNSDFGKFRAGKKAERQAYIRAGTYSGAGGFLNPRNVRSRANAKINSSAVYDAATGGFGTRRSKSADKWQAEEVRGKIEQFEAEGSDPRAIYDREKAALEAVRANPRASQGDRHSQEIRLKAAQAHLLRTLGTAGAEHIYGAGGGSGGSSSTAPPRSGPRPSPVPMPVPGPTGTGGEAPTVPGTGSAASKLRLSGYTSADPATAAKMNSTAANVLQQVSDAGGWGALSHEDVWAAKEHAEKALGGVNDDATNRLGSEAIDELQRRNILPGPNNPDQGRR